MAAEWTERHGLLHGLVAGTLVAGVLAGLLVFGFELLLPERGILGSFHTARMFIPLALVGLFFNSVVLSACEHFGGMMCRPFAGLSAVASLLTGAALAWTTVDGMRWTEAGWSPLGTALIWVGLPYALGTLPSWAVLFSRESD